MTAKKSQPKERREKPSSDRGKEIKKPFHIFASNGWVQNVVSGLIIIPILGWIGIGIWHFIALITRADLPSESKTSAAITSANPSEMPGPRQITDQISSAAPYQQDAIAESFANTPVDWTLYLAFINRYPKEKGLLQIALKNDEEFGPNERIVNLWVPVVGNERLSLLKKNSLVRVRGFIKSADMFTIDLKDGATIEPIEAK